MSTFRNNKGSVVGMASKKGSTVTARDAKGSVVATYDSKTNVTRNDADGRSLGTGNLISTLFRV
jgi:hypothetical protein